jgi:integrase
LLTHDLAEETADYYRRMVSVLCSWAKRRVPLIRFTPDLVNQMLVDKQRAGLSSHYRRSLRNAMRALLGHKYNGLLPGKLRPVRLDPLNPESWTAEEVQRLIVACNYMRDTNRRLWWQTIIAAGYYTGLSPKDLWRLTPGELDATGIVRTSRSKTGTSIAMRLPEPWLSRTRQVSGKRLIWGRPMAKEVFRATFARVVKKAGLAGTFKRLRKSCGTSVEMRHPGQGHIALGNTRKVFEQHYLSRRPFDQNPPAPDQLPEC